MFERIRKFFTGPDQKRYIPMTKHYVFNETGNIMLCATADSIGEFNDDIKDSFIDVSVFFSAMTKAVHSTQNPVTGKPFSIYNYQAVKNILGQSGMFIELNVEEGVFSNKGVGTPMGKALIQRILNRKLPESRLGFLRGMFNGMGYQKIDTEKGAGLNKTQLKLCRSGHIFFVCELMLGLPQTSAVLVNIEPYSFNNRTRKAEKDAQDIFQLGKKDEKTHRHKGNLRYWKFKKRTYVFVPPKFLKKNITALRDADGKEFEDLVESIAGRLHTLTGEQLRSPA
ncbi:MAG: hypothetical protein MI863_27265 [Desulfobacterales bacterium]|nr:hypothetical protein [Desulfobacterales bacterium]